MDNFNYFDHIPSSAQNVELPIYYHPKYIQGLGTETKSFCAIRKDNLNTIQIIHFQIAGTKAISLKMAPFGGIYCNEPSAQSDKRDFLVYVLEQLRQHGIFDIIIKTAPPFYNSIGSIEPTPYTDLKFLTQTTTDINHHILINQNALVDHVSSMQKRRLKKCVDAHFSFKKENTNQLETIFHFISECRKEKSHSISLSFEKMNSNLKLLPKKYLIFSCYDNNTLVAATICVVVNSKVLYNFLPASALAYNSYSPMVFLISHIYQFCKNNQFEILDLGTSMLDEQPNQNLIVFKERIGGIQTERNLYSLNL